MLPWAHGQQRKAIWDFVQAIINQQTGWHAQVARHFGNQAAAPKRLSRRLPTARLAPHHLAAAVLLQALVPLRSPGPVRLAIDWPIEGPQHLLVVSLLMGRRAVPMYWRAYDATVLTGRMQRYALAVMRRAVTRVLRQGGRRRVRLPAARGCAEVARFTLLTDVGVAFVSRVKKSTQLCLAGGWHTLDPVCCAGNPRRRPLGQVLYGAGHPQSLWVPMRRTRDRQGQWGRWALVATRPYTAAQAVAEDARQPGGAAGFRDATWWRGFAPARVKAITAWARLFAWFAVALLVVARLAPRWLLRGGKQAQAGLRRVASRRRGRCELRLLRAMSRLLHQAPGVYDHLAPRIKLKLEGD
jgi:hypothetical protein